MSAEHTKSYQPADVEPRWFSRWTDADCFRGDENSPQDGYSIVIPPPNVTGILHLGHVLNNTIQDILARRARMSGKAVLWLPGTDHAGIATQTKVEREIRQNEGKSRHDLGRDAFLKRVWDWKEKHGGIIINQLKRLGCSCDWSRERFTMDPGYSRWVEHTFIDLFRRGLIYRGRRMVNWCPVSHTALSDEEVIMTPQKSKLYTMRYKLADGSGFLQIATTRPETLMGDTGVAVNPNDPRYRHLIGKSVIRPFPEAEIPIVADDLIDPEFGSGVLKVTPAHDKADFEIGQRHGLPAIDVLNPDGTMNALAGKDFEGMDRFDAREKAAAKLDQMDLLVKVEDYENNVGFSERAGVPIEPRLSMQWFLRYPAVQEATDAVASGEITFRPDRWKKTYLHWMENIQDWCISRQLWWGHRIPVWYRKSDAEKLQDIPLEAGSDGIHVGHEPPADGEWIQDPDVLDTWFSSWLWPFATMSDVGENSPTLKKFYPTADLVTGPDILFFWVARMIMAGYAFEGQKPFHNVFYTSIIRDKEGRKLSKSLGNSPDPLDIIDLFGADALRFAILRAAPLGSDIRFIENHAESKPDARFPQVAEGRNFATKIWNAVRYRQMQGENPAPSAIGDASHLPIYAVDILAKLDSLRANLDKAYAAYRFSDIAALLYEFFWNNFCDLYLESVKRDFRDSAAPGAKEATLATMDAVLERFLLFLHPYMPHISEELWDMLGFAAKNGGEFLMRTRLPDSDLLAAADPELIRDAQTQAAAIYADAAKVRNLKTEYNLATRKDVRLVVKSDQAWVAREAATLALLCGAAEVTCDPTFEAPNGTPSLLCEIGEVVMPLGGLIDIAAERERLTKELQKVSQELAKTHGKLTNDNFISRAKPEVVDQERARKLDWEQKRDQLKAMLNALPSSGGGL